MYTFLSYKRIVKWTVKHMFLYICELNMQEWFSIYETNECDIGTTDIYMFPQVDGLSTGPPDLGRHTACAHRDPTVPSSAFLVPPISSPYLDVNAGIGPQATKSLGCSILQLCQTNQTWGGEPPELLVAEGY